MYLHELGHVLGLIHEHVRPDRDQYIELNLEGVKREALEFFDNEDDEDIITYDTPYDLQSVMHYGANVRFSFSSTIY